MPISDSRFPLNPQHLSASLSLRCACAPPHLRCLPRRQLIGDGVLFIPPCSPGRSQTDPTLRSGGGGISVLWRRFILAFRPKNARVTHNQRSLSCKRTLLYAQKNFQSFVTMQLYVAVILACGVSGEFIAVSLCVKCAKPLARNLFSKEL